MTLDEALEIIGQQRAQIDEMQRQLRLAQDRIAQVEQVAARQAAPFCGPEERKVAPQRAKTAWPQAGPSRGFNSRGSGSRFGPG